jgi:CheY-like chemotaxis protein
MPNGGTVTVGAENIISRQNGHRFVRITITDRGTGISEQDQERIFDPYFTTKQSGKGLGLATCFSIIQKHGGRLRVTSKLGVGSTFYISLPAAEGEYSADPYSQDKTVQGSGRVLIMDDEETVREIAQELLEEIGYTVECVANGSDAVELYRKRKEEGSPYSVVILDLTVSGGMGGREALSKILEIDPNVKAVVSSGYSTDSAMANYQDYGFSAVLSKPYKLEEISSVMQELLQD